jgi:RNA polymerase sigma factor (sigma-70 family)
LIFPLQNSENPVLLLNSKNDFESEMVKGLRAGERESLAQLYSCYSGSLFGIIFKMVKLEYVAEDLLQETFLTICESINQFDSSKVRLFTWMALFAKNKSLDYVKRKIQLDAALNNQIDRVGIDVDQSHQTNWNPETMGVKKTESLTPTQKQILELIYFQGFTQSEVAEEMEIPIETVKARIRLAIQSLRRCL